MNAPDLFALGGSEDAELLALFRRWYAAMHATENTPSGECDREMGIATGIAEQIFDARPEGPIGLAIKAFLFAFEVCQLESFTQYRRGDDPCALGRPEPNNQNYSHRLRGDDWTPAAQLYLLQHSMVGLLDAVARFVPDLAPLLDGVLSSPRTLPPDADDEEDDEDEVECFPAVVGHA